MYQLLLQQDPPVKTTTYILLLQLNQWKHGGNLGRPPTQGQDSTTAVQPFRNFSPNFLSLLFLTFFAAIQDTPILLVTMSSASFYIPSTFLPVD